MYLLLVYRWHVEHLGAGLVHWRCSGVLVLGFPRFHCLLDGCVRCLLCANDLNVSNRGRATFVGHCQTDGHIERDSSYCLFRHMELLDKFGNVLSLGRRELREAAVGEMAVPVIESRPKMSVEEAVKLEISISGALYQSTVLLNEFALRVFGLNIHPVVARKSYYVTKFRSPSQYYLRNTFNLAQRKSV